MPGACLGVVLAGLAGCTTGSMPDAALNASSMSEAAPPDASTMAKRRHLIDVIEKQRTLISKLKAQRKAARSAPEGAARVIEEADLANEDNTDVYGYSTEDLQSIVAKQQRLIEALRKQSVP